MPLPFRGAVPMVVVPSLNVTLPVGTAGERGATVAVRVTEAPPGAGWLKVSAVVVESLFTTWEIGLDVLPPLLVSPP
jgi:hypothetical protein